jgi:ribonuclease Z
MSALNVTDVLEGYSKAIYSTWFYYGPDRLLFDAGEGVASRLENRAFAIRKICLSHGHLDHISGLPTLLNIRSAGMGEKTKPLEIYYPEGDRYVEGLKAHLDRAMGRLTYDLSWLPIGPGARIPLNSDEDEPTHQHARFLETFETRHGRNRTLGYRVVEHRNRLKPEFTGRPQDEIRALVQAEGRAAITEEFDHRLLAYLGDGVPIDVAPFADADILLHEATFLDAADRENYVHSTLEEAVKQAVAARARHLVLFHISSRYPRRDMRRAVPKALAALGFDPARAWLVYERHWDNAARLGP